MFRFCNSSLRLLPLFVLGGCSPSLAADAAKATRVATPPPLNGQVADWAAIPTSQTWLDANGAPVGTLKLAFDDQALYAQFLVKDPSPLRNATPLSDAPMLLKGGDAVGLTLGGTPERLLFGRLQGRDVAVLYRPQSAIKKPYVFRSPVGEVTFDYAAILPSARVKLVPTSGGYLGEVALPWRDLGLTAPRDGDQMPFDAQIIFSDAAGQSNASTLWWNTRSGGALSTVDLPSEARLYPESWGTVRFGEGGPVAGGTLPAPTTGTEAGVGDERGVPIQFSLPRDERVSLAITREDGWILREVLTVQSLQKGPHRVLWNGRDDYGDPLPPGNYRWKLVQFAGVGSKRIGGAGNSARPPYRTPDGKGDLSAAHGIPTTLASDAGGVYHLGHVEEGNPGLTKLSTDGFVLWKKSLGGFARGVGVFSDGTFAYLMVRGGDKRISFIKMDARTGEEKPFDGGSSRLVLPDETDDRDVIPFTTGGRGYGLVVTGNHAFYSVHQRDEIAVVNLTNDQKEASISLPSPFGMAQLNASTLLVCSGNRVVKLDVPSRQITPFLEGLDAPHAVAVAPNGDVYVALRGASQQIVRFSSQGRELACIGARGGRPATQVPYDPNAFYNLGALTFAPDGRLWFMEHSELRRSGVLEPGGKWVRDIWQTPPAQAGAGVDLSDASRVFFQPGYSSFAVQAKINFARVQQAPDDPASYWKPEAIFNLTQGADYNHVAYWTDPIKDAPQDMAAKSAASPYFPPVAFTATNGKRYLFHEGTIGSLWMKNAAGRPIPIVAIGPRGEGDGAVVPKDRYWSWSDANGDGQLEREELDLSEKVPVEVRSLRWVGPDLTLYGMGSPAPYVFAPYTLKPWKVDARGVPFYHVNDAKFDVTQGQPLAYYFRDDSYAIQDGPPASDGARYFAFNIGAAGGQSFWDRASMSRLARVKNGRIEWIAGQHDGTKKHDGDASFLWRPLGEVGGVVVVGDVDFQLLAYTSDGLSLGALEPHFKDGLTPENIFQENVQAGHFLRDPVTKKPLIVIGSGTEAVVLEVTGMGAGALERQSGTVALPSAAPRGDAFTGAYPVAYQTWPATDNGRHQGVNGDDWEWQKNTPALLLRDASGALVGDVRLRRDAGELHLFVSFVGAGAFPLGADDPVPGQASGLGIALGAPGEDLTQARHFFLSAKREGVEANAQPRFSTSVQVQQNGAWQKAEGAQIAVREALNGQGFHLEASLPLSLFPRLTQEREVSFVRSDYQPKKRGNDQNEKYTEKKPDLSGNFQVEVALHRLQGGKVEVVKTTSAAVAP